MKWFRFYAEALHNRKVQRLSPVLFKHWVNLLCLVAAEEKQGEIPEVSDVAYHLGVNEKRADDILEELVEVGLIDAVDEPRLFIHNWSERQPRSDNASERMRNIRRTSSEQVRPSSEHVRPREEEIREEQKRIDEEEMPTRRNVFVLYDQYMGKPSVTAMIRGVLLQAEEDYPEECITHCFEIAAKSSDGRRSWGYVESILKRHQAEGCNERKPVGRNGAAAPQVGDAAAELARINGGFGPVYVPDYRGPDEGASSLVAPPDTARLEVRR